MHKTAACFATVLPMTTAVSTCVAQNGHAKIEASQLTLSKAASPEVKAFAQTMIEENTRIGQELNAPSASIGLKAHQDAVLKQITQGHQQH